MDHFRDGLFPVGIFFREGKAPAEPAERSIRKLGSFKPRSSLFGR